MQNKTHTLYRQSPVTLENQPKKVGWVNGFEVVLEYEDEMQKKGPALTDLSHLAKWDIQGQDSAQVAICGTDIPSVSGECRVQNDRVIFRMNPTQAGIWHVCAEDDAPELPDNPACTDITDAWALFGLAGEAIPRLFEQITELDLMSPSRSIPRFLQGPIFQVPCQIVLIKCAADGTIAMIAFPRGFGQAAAETLLDTGSGIGLHPIGLNAFFDLLGQAFE